MRVRWQWTFGLLCQLLNEIIFQIKWQDFKKNVLNIKYPGPPLLSQIPIGFRFPWKSPKIFLHHPTWIQMCVSSMHWLPGKRRQPLFIREMKTLFCQHKKNCIHLRKNATENAQSTAIGQLTFFSEHYILALGVLCINDNIEYSLQFLSARNYYGLLHNASQRIQSWS